MLSNKTKYALKSLIYVAREGRNRIILSTEIARKENIPKKFLEAVLVLLKKSGYLESKRGKTGGYYLARNADLIMMGDVIRNIEGPLAPISCVSVTAYKKCKDCKDEHTCEVREMMKEVRDAIASILDNINLAEAVKKGKSGPLF